MQINGKALIDYNTFLTINTLMTEGQEKGRAAQCEDKESKK